MKKNYNLFELMKWCNQRDIDIDINIVNHGIKVTFFSDTSDVEVFFNYDEYDVFEPTLCEIAVDIATELGKI